MVILFSLVHNTFSFRPIKTIFILFLYHYLAIIRYRIFKFLSEKKFHVSIKFFDKILILNRYLLYNLGNKHKISIFFYN